MAHHAEIYLKVESAEPPSTALAAAKRDKDEFIVLLLEDEPLIAMDVEMTLGDAGFTVSSVMTCEEANAWLDRHLPDVVIVDIELRDGRCTDVVTRLVEANIPFVVHSGDQSAMQADTPFSHGVCIGKPAASDALVRAVRSTMVFLGPAQRT